MEHFSDQCWASFESLRYRVRSICQSADADELASIDAEMIELRELTCTSLRAFEDGVRPSLP